MSNDNETAWVGANEFICVFVSRKSLYTWGLPNVYLALFYLFFFFSVCPTWITFLYLLKMNKKLVKWVKKRSMAGYSAVSVFFVCFPLFIYISTEMSQRSSSWERLAPSGDVAGFPFSFSSAWRFLCLAVIVDESHIHTAHTHHTQSYKHTHTC